MDSVSGPTTSGTCKVKRNLVLQGFACAHKSQNSQQTKSIYFILKVLSNLNYNFFKYTHAIILV